MARQIIITDDMDGSFGATRRVFSVGGESYTLDLSDRNFEKLIQAVAPFVKAAKSSSAPQTSSAKIPKSLVDTIEEHRARNSQMVIRYHAIKDRTSGIGHACRTLASEFLISAQRIRQIVGTTTLADAEQYLATHP